MGPAPRPSKAERRGFSVFTRTGGDTTTALSVYYKVKGTATNGVRVLGPGGLALPGVAIIPAGATRLKVKVKAVNDSVHEGTERVKVVLKASPTGAYTLGTETLAVIHVIDND